MRSITGGYEGRFLALRLRRGKPEPVVSPAQVDEILTEAATATTYAAMRFSRDQYLSALAQAVLELRGVCECPRTQRPKRTGGT